MPRNTTRSTTFGFLLRKQGLEASENQYETAGPRTQTSPNFDPRQQTAAALHSFDNTLRLHVGTITDTCALANAYRVQLEKGHQPIVAYWLPSSSLNIFGAKGACSIVPGTSVIVACHPQMSYGLIIGAYPQSQFTARRTLPEMVSQTTRHRVDQAHRHPLLMNDNGRIADKLLGRFFDMTFVGEQGWVTETGLKIFIDPFMAMLAADEMTGVFCFYHDQLCRVGGYNLQFRSAGYERDSLDDQEENHEYEGWSLYPWEHCGQFERTDPRKTNPPESWQLDQPWYAAWEPKDDWQQSFDRTQEFHGYLGQGWKVHVSGRPQQPPSHYAYAGGKVDPRQIQLPGLFDLSIQADGRVLMQSAKGIHLVKRCGIVTPNRCKRAEQSKAPLGDGPDNYKHSGAVGNGPEHKITGDLRTTAEAKELQRVTSTLDMHAYMFNYAGLHPFFYHEHDWFVPEESELEYTQGQSVIIPDFQDLSDTMFLTAPTPYKLDIDHRLTQQEYFQNEAGLDILEDGGVVLYDGFGGEHRMTAGSQWISAPGDLWLKAGRNIVLMAGADIIFKGYNSIDIDATNKDIRIKARKNIQTVSTDGGVLVESQAEGVAYNYDLVGEEAVSSGIVFKTRHSNTVTLAKNIYLRTGGGNIDPGVIVIDANMSQEEVFINASRVHEYLVDAHFMHYGSMTDTPTDAKFEVQKSNEFSKNFTTICTQTGINGTLAVKGDILAQGWLLVAAGHVLTEYAPQFVGYVGELSGQSLSQTYTAASDIQNRAELIMPNTGESFFELLTQQFYAEKQIGTDDVIQKAEFTWRTPEHMHTKEFRLYEDRWQQLARLGKKDTATWEEQPLTTVVQGDMYPYPGKESWEGDTFYQPDPAIFDVENGCSKDRGQQPNLSAAYADCTFGDVNPVPLQGNYTIIRRP